ncbi:acetyltransferase, GNAT family [Streptococcus cristatus ATCC 51100]|uniref:Acetyltransferase, GNAT family n=1 Tax=Streptococcus cristatus ATCC 51100 TaxID=889201 RepID=A0AAV3EED7_STRCR|nr:GNAT family N-acetyltransferase [Streptococcus cristatus]EFX52854.1 acetyltransferase, GNAT family [Streptococcus cristatus ATCC 51100]EGU66886.1 acetyltransferase, GNAT family [Streptococcus cristatus ATCC 51100]KJQ57478.1 acetyltransferase (GNAT) family protein [Streptococcus cristatus]SQG31852.1 acetyltransferase [Streptococcus cristatus ATCC 51100]
MWHKKYLNELDTLEFYKILKLRIDTFVVEQERIYHKLDEKDLKAVHIFHVNKQEEIDAYARVFEKAEKVVFGRLVTASSARGKGLGSRLVEEILILCEKEWLGKIIEIEAQEQVVGFYEKFGFVTQGEPFIFESTPHIKMIYKK